MQYPKTLIRNPNDVTISWENIYGENHNDFKLQIRDEFKQWKTVYRGPKTLTKVDGLAPCTCYQFRLKTDENSEEWLEFKAATEDIGPYTSVIHMTRAVRLGKTSVIRKIAQMRPVLLNAENKENKTPIFQAIETGDLQIIQLLITLGANVNKPQRHTKRTALMFAIYRGELQAATLLMDKGASIYCQDINGLTILHYAVDSNELNNVKFAIDCKVDINMQDNSGWSPLLRAG
ncbi:fibronectin type 3 and ankyrin repeat domains protein 1-like isoform X2 [Anthonomus grandis grandis]|nr:fibronectin type 3 and ankyrin repeat domains protein 1-like isoform X2 [Anthonomus grandis grandis]